MAVQTLKYTALHAMNARGLPDQIVVQHWMVFLGPRRPCLASCTVQACRGDDQRSVAATVEDTLEAGRDPGSETYREARKANREGR